MAQGNVKWFSTEKGYGFIAPNDGRDDVFVHRSSIDNLAYGEGLSEGEQVEFDIEETPKGLSATNVRRVQEEF